MKGSMHFDPTARRYGSAGSEMWLDAAHFLNNLLAPKTDMAFGPSDLPQWDEDDTMAFAYCHDLEGSLPFLEPGPSVDGRDLANLFRNVRELNTYIPFNEGERHWLDPRWRTRRLHHEGPTFVDELLVAEATIISAGVQQQLNGIDLVRRWAAWRREEHEFKRQESLRTAQKLLGRIARELVSPSDIDGRDISDVPYAAKILAGTA
jgi:hypothetical protein